MIVGAMPQPAWNCFIPKDGIPQSAKNKWNSWCQKVKKTHQYSRKPGLVLKDIRVSNWLISTQGYVPPSSFDFLINFQGNNLRQINLLWL